MDDDDYSADEQKTEQPQFAFQGAMELEEEVNMEALRKIRDNFPEVFRRMGSFKALNEKTKEFEETDEKTALTIINEMYHEKKKSKLIKYRYVARLTSGRRYAKLSLQGLHRQVRHAIAKDIYYDVDMCNAHPSFTLELCKKLGFSHRILKMYCENRPACIQRWIGTKIKENDTVRVLRNKEDVKQYFLKLSYGGGNKNSDNEELNECYERNQELLAKVFDLPEFKHHRERANRKYKKEKSDWDNRKGSCMSYYLGELENNILTEMEFFLQEKGIKYGALCFDGLMIYKKDVEDINDLLRQLEACLEKKMGFVVKLANKEMNEDVDISDLTIKEDLKTTDEDYAKKILELLKDDLMYDPSTKKLFIYEPVQALWKERKPKHIRTLVSTLLIPYIMTSPDPKVIEEEVDTIKSDSFQSSIVRMCEPYIEARDDTLFIKNNFDRKKGILPIADVKTIDLRTSIVRERQKTDYFTKTTQRRKLTLTPEERQAVLDYFTSLLTLYVEDKTEEKKASDKLRDNLIMTLAHILTGEMLKKIFNFIGKRDGGKSCFLDLIVALLEGFACWGNSRLFVAQRAKSVHDSELFNLIGKKMCCLSETDKEERYNEELLKKISGGDAVNIRGAGEKETIDTIFNCVLVIACNEPSQFNDPAFKSRLICFNFCNKFEKKADYLDILKSKVDYFFTVVVEYAQQFYKDGCQIKWENEVVNYTGEVCDMQDTIKVWLKKDVGRIMPSNEKNGIERGEFYERYKHYWTGNNRKWEGKNTFFDRIEEIYKVQAKKVAGRGMCWGIAEEGAEL